MARQVQVFSVRSPSDKEWRLTPYPHGGAAVRVDVNGAIQYPGRDFLVTADGRVVFIGTDFPLAKGDVVQVEFDDGGA